MPSSGSWNNTTYSIPLAGELNWSVLSNFIIDLRNNAQTTNSQKIGARVATSTPVTVSAITDAVIGINIGSASAVNLPAGVTGQVFTIVDTSGAAATNNITIDANAAETINGSATYVINRNNAGVTLAWTGTEWRIISEVVSQGSTTGTGNLVFSASPTFTGILSSNTHNILGTTATNLLSVSDGTNALHVLPGDAGGGYTPGVIIETTNNVPLHFGTNSSASQAQLTTSGNFGVATVTPLEKFHCTGNAIVTGNVGIGTTNTLNAELEIAGNLFLNLNNPNIHLAQSLNTSNVNGQSGVNVDGGGGPIISTSGTGLVLITNRDTDNVSIIMIAGTNQVSTLIHETTPQITINDVGVPGLVWSFGYRGGAYRLYNATGGGNINYSAQFIGANA